MYPRSSLGHSPCSTDASRRSDATPGQRWAEVLRVVVAGQGPDVCGYVVTRQQGVQAATVRAVMFSAACLSDSDTES